MVRLATTVGRAGRIGASSLLVIGAAVATTLGLRARLRRHAEIEWQQQWHTYTEAIPSRDEA